LLHHVCVVCVLFAFVASNPLTTTLYAWISITNGIYIYIYICIIVIVSRCMYVHMAFNNIMLSLKVVVSCEAHTHYMHSFYMLSTYMAIKMHCMLKHRHTSTFQNLSQCSSAQTRLRAKFKHISQRSAKTKTNQDSLSNGEWSGKY